MGSAVGLLGSGERAAGRRSVHKAVITVIVNCVKGRDFQIWEAVAEGGDAHEMRTGAFKSKCRGVRWREARMRGTETWLLVKTRHYLAT